MVSDNSENNYVTVPISSLVKPLFVFGDYGGNTKKKVCALPKINWAVYFGNKIKTGASKLDETPVDKEVNEDEEMGH